MRGLIVKQGLRCLCHCLVPIVFIVFFLGPVRLHVRLRSHNTIFYCIGMLRVSCLVVFDAQVCIPAPTLWFLVEFNPRA